MGRRVKQGVRRFQSGFHGHGGQDRSVGVIYPWKMCMYQQSEINDNHEGKY